MPSRDTHALRDDDASTDRELLTQFVYTPAKPQAKETPGTAYSCTVISDILVML